MRRQEWKMNIHFWKVSCLWRIFSSSFLRVSDTFCRAEGAEAEGKGSWNYWCPDRAVTIEIRRDSSGPVAVTDGACTSHLRDPLPKHQSVGAALIIRRMLENRQFWGCDKKIRWFCQLWLMVDYLWKISCRCEKSSHDQGYSSKWSTLTYCASHVTLY